MSEKKTPQTILKKVLIGHFAMWAVRQSPYLLPENLDKSIQEFDKHLISNIKIGDEDLIEATYTDLSKNIKDAISKSSTILSWNVAKMGSGSVFISPYSKVKSDYDFIDLDALARNIAQSVWREQKDTMNPYLIM